MSWRTVPYCLLLCLAVVSTGCLSTRPSVFAESREPVPGREPPLLSADIVPIAAKMPADKDEGPDPKPLPMGKELPKPEKASEPPPPAKPPEILPPVPPIHPPQRGEPTLIGKLGIRPGETPIEKAVELSKDVENLRAEAAKMSLRLQAMEEEVRNRDTVIKGATTEVQAASTEIAQAREQMRTWAAELRSQESKLKLQERSQREQLLAIIKVLEKATAPSGVHR